MPQFEQVEANVIFTRSPTFYQKATTAFILLINPKIALYLAMQVFIFVHFFSTEPLVLLAFKIP